MLKQYVKIRNYNAFFPLMCFGTYIDAANNYEIIPRAQILLVLIATMSSVLRYNIEDLCSWLVVNC
jgi:hypothetical protein